MIVALQPAVLLPHVLSVLIATEDADYGCRLLAAAMLVEVLGAVEGGAMSSGQVSHCCDGHMNAMCYYYCAPL